ncbi:GNAT family N-acetyltransferase [Oenococcus sp. UCMA 16435]|nr:GNAT family N-acetyltransferase [Oenococcus sp. UCMA 16435]MDI4584740.1 GNAT family N-acetyltransferase [Oenococcus sp. UCMA 14587]MDN6968811.1 GNAT family N-acetyltransferase [Oenococcus sp. UCMA 17063]
MTEVAECLLKLGFSSQFLNKISASCVPDNIGSKKVLEKNGMRDIGITKKAFKKNGTAFDLENFEITKEVYLKKDD